MKHAVVLALCLVTCAPAFFGFRFLVDLRSEAYDEKVKSCIGMRDSEVRSVLGPPVGELVGQTAINEFSAKVGWGPGPEPVAAESALWYTKGCSTAILYFRKQRVAEVYVGRN